MFVNIKQDFTEKVERSKNVKIKEPVFRLAIFLNRVSFSSYLHRFIYFNNLFFTISKEVLYEDLFKSVLKTLSKVKDTRISSGQNLHPETLVNLPWLVERIQIFAI